jgi:hypothetical protein
MSPVFLTTRARLVLWWAADISGQPRMFFIAGTRDPSPLIHTTERRAAILAKGIYLHAYTLSYCFRTHVVGTFIDGMFGNPRTHESAATKSPYVELKKIGKTFSEKLFFGPIGAQHHGTPSALSVL